MNETNIEKIVRVQKEHDKAIIFQVRYRKLVIAKSIELARLRLIEKLEQKERIGTKQHTKSKGL